MHLRSGTFIPFVHLIILKSITIGNNYYNFDMLHEAYSTHPVQLRTMI